MTGTNYLYKDHQELAHKIKTEIKTKFGYTVNIGIANNKLCAKMASDFEKPDRVHTLYEEEIQTKLWPLNVKDLFMVGKKSAQELNKLNIYTIEQLANTDFEYLQKHFKNQAKYLKEAAWGIDYTKVEPRNSKTTSISTTETLPYDYLDEDKLKEILFRQTEEVSRQLRYRGQYARTVAVIYKNSQFINYSAQAKLTNPSNNTKEIYNLVIEIFEKSYKKDPIRLVGVRLSDFADNKETQLSLFEENFEDDESDIQKTMDKINNKFGKGLIAPAALKVISKSTSKKSIKPQR